MNRTRRVIVIGLMMLGAGSIASADRYVAQTNQIPDPAGEYTNWGNAASNIQEAVDAAVNGDTVWVAPGTYGEPPAPVVTSGITNMVSIAKWITVRSSSGNPADTTIDAGGVQNKRCVRIDTTASGTPTQPFRLSGFTLTNGYANGGGVRFDIDNRVRTAVVDNCIIAGNRGGGSAGGVYAYYTGTPSATVILSNSVVRNSIDGGMYKSLYGKTIVTGCRFENNTPYAIDSWNGSNVIDSCVFANNAKTNANQGAGITFWNSASYNEVRNSLFYKNRFINTEPTVFRTGGAAIGLGNLAVAYLYNCTIVSNVASGYGALSGGIFTHSSTTYKIWNSIIRGNYRDATHSNYGSGGGGSPVILFTNSCTYPLTGFPAEAQNINVDPEFVNVDAGDYRLTKNSLCLNTGTNQPWMRGADDLDGNPRLDSAYGRVDMGCYEYLYHGTTILIQ